LPAWRILAEAPPPELQGAIVFVGTSAPGLLDLRFGPLGQLPGVALHALAVEQVMTGEFLARPGWTDGVECTFFIVSAALIILLVFKTGPLRSATAAVALAGLGVVLAGYGFVALHLIFEPFYAVLALGAVFFAAFVPRQFLAEREGRWIRRAFSSYVSPNLVEHLIANHDQLRLGGERRECSFVLTDIAGFTQLVESSDPATLVGLLNDYLDGMVRIAFRHEGTLDKVVGDAVAVMFSAPVVQPDHAQRAVACALDMDAFAQRFAAERRAQGLKLGTTRIGVNTGTVIVGNVGGATLDYRPLGDAINTASRLETVNKQLGTRICVSNATAERCPGFIGRKVGQLVLVGKSTPILAWEPLTPERQKAPEIAAYNAAFTLLEAEDPAAEAAFEALAETDPLACFHSDRLARGETGTLVTLQQK
jgi:adenylate cyclase